MATGINQGLANTIANNLTFDNEYPKQGENNPSQQFRDNYKVIEANITNLQKKKLILSGDLSGESDIFDSGSDPIIFDVTLSNAYLPLHGGTLSGPLALSGDPINLNHAANKNYVDVKHTALKDDLELQISSISTGSGFVVKTGDTMEGVLNMNNYKITDLANPSDLKDAVNLSYLNTRYVKKSGDILNGPLSLNIPPVDPNHLVNKAYLDVHDFSNRYVPLSGNNGNEMTGPLLLSNNVPTLNEEATRKDYVDNQIDTHTHSNYIEITGNTSSPMTGPLVLYGIPASPDEAANKFYVDEAISAVSGGASSTFLPISGGVMTGHIVLHNEDPQQDLHPIPKYYFDTHQGFKTRTTGNEKVIVDADHQLFAYDEFVIEAGTELQISEDAELVVMHLSDEYIGVKNRIIKNQVMTVNRYCQLITFNELIIDYGGEFIIREGGEVIILSPFYTDDVGPIYRNIEEMDDVNVVSVSDGDSLVYNASTSKWRAASRQNQDAWSEINISSGNHSGDTYIISDTEEDVLTLSGGTDISLHGDSSSKSITISFNGTIPQTVSDLTNDAGFISGIADLNDIANVDSSAAVSGNMLRYNGTTWVPENPPSAPTLTDLGVSTFAQTILDDTSEADVQTTLGISPYAQTLLDDTENDIWSTLNIPVGERNLWENSYVADETELLDALSTSNLIIVTQDITVTSTISLPANTHLVILSNSSLIADNALNAPVIEIAGDNVSITGQGSINGNSDNQTQGTGGPAHGIQISNNSSVWTISNIVIKDVENNAINFSASSVSETWTIKDVKIRKADETGIFIQNAVNGKVSNIIVSNTSDTTISVVNSSSILISGIRTFDSGILLDRTANTSIESSFIQSSLTYGIFAVQCRSTTIHNNIIDSAYATGIRSEGGVNITINDNIITSVGQDTSLTDDLRVGIRVTLYMPTSEMAKNITVRNNTIIDDQYTKSIRYGIMSDTLTEDINIIHNRISGCYLDGIYAISNQELTISNNDVSLNGNNGIHIKGCKKIQMLENDCYDNSLNSASGGGIVIANEPGKTTDELFVLSNRCYDDQNEVQYVASINDSENSITLQNRHGFGNNQIVELTTTGGVPGGLSLATNYFVIVVDEMTIKLSASFEGPEIDFTSTGFGNHQVTLKPKQQYGFIIDANVTPYKFENNHAFGNVTSEYSLSGIWKGGKYCVPVKPYSEVSSTITASSSELLVDTGLNLDVQLETTIAIDNAPASGDVMVMPLIGYKTSTSTQWIGAHNFSSSNANVTIKGFVA